MKIGRDRKDLPADASNEGSNFVLDGVQHKYRETIAVFVSLVCKQICPWCFRGPRIFRGELYPHDKIAKIHDTIEWIKKHPEITNVLLTGGDALTAPNLLAWTGELNKIRHVKIIRIGTRLPIFEPRYLEIEKYIKLTRKRLIFVLQALVPDELKNELKEYTGRKGVCFLAQTPLLRGINDSPGKLVGLWRKLLLLGISPYYVFHCRPVKGNEKYIMTLGEGYEIFQEAQNRCAGAVKRARYVMSANIGKLEIIGREGNEVILKIHQARNKKDLGKLLRYPASEQWYE